MKRRKDISRATIYCFLVVTVSRVRTVYSLSISTSQRSARKRGRCYYYCECKINPPYVVICRLLFFFVQAQGVPTWFKLWNALRDAVQSDRFEPKICDAGPSPTSLCTGRQPMRERICCTDIIYLVPKTLSPPVHASYLLTQLFTLDFLLLIRLIYLLLLFFLV